MAVTLNYFRSISGLYTSDRLFTMITTIGKIISLQILLTAMTCNKYSVTLLGKINLEIHLDYPIRIFSFSGDKLQKFCGKSVLSTKV